MTAIKVSYPQANQETLAVTITLGSSLSSSSSLLVGREATAIDNTSNLDIDHLLSGVFKTGTSPSAGGKIEVWAFAPQKISSGGTYTWPQGATGADAALTLNSDNAKFSGWLKLAASITVDDTTGRSYDFGGISVAMLFGGFLPPKWSLFVTQYTGVALDNTAGANGLWYERVQAQA